MEYSMINRDPDAFQQPIPLEQIVAMCQHAFDHKRKINNIHELGGGGCNNTYRIDIEDLQPVILRVAPAYENAVKGQVAYLMRKEHFSQPFFVPIATLMPRTIMADFTHQTIERDYMFQTYMEGERWDAISSELTHEENSRLWRQRGEITRAIHSVRGKTFGSVYPDGPALTCSQATFGRLSHTINALEGQAHLDADDLKTALEIAETHREIFDEMQQPCLLHGDLWTVNVLVKREADGPRISAVLDADRTSWGDPMADWTIFLIKHHNYEWVLTFWEGYGGEPEITTRSRFRELVYRCSFLAEMRHEAWA